MNTHKNTLLQYKDKVFIYQILTAKASDYYNTLKSFVNIPLIIASSAMSIINSSFPAEDMKIVNICINASTALMIGLINNFKIVEKASNFRNISLKYMSLLHHIEDVLANDKDIDSADFKQICLQYDELLSQVDIIPSHIKNKTKKLYSGKKNLPLILVDDSSNVSPRCQRTESKKMSIITDNFVL